MGTPFFSVRYISLSGDVCWHEDREEPVGNRASFYLIPYSLYGDTLFSVICISLNGDVYWLEDREETWNRIELSRDI